MIWIDLTKKCNLRCSYCDNHYDHSCSKEVILRCFEKFPEALYCFSGGEPFLVDYLDELVSKVNCVVYTNGTIRRKIDCDLVTSFHLEYSNLWQRVYENTRNNKTIYNVICRKFSDYPFEKLEPLLLKIKEDNNLVNIQPDCSQPYEIEEIRKFYEKMDMLGVRTQYSFKEVLKYFEPCKCINNSFKLMPDGSLKPDCDKKIGLVKCKPNCRMHEFLMHHF